MPAAGNGEKAEEESSGAGAEGGAQATRAAASERIWRWEAEETGVAAGCCDLGKFGVAQQLALPQWQQASAPRWTLDAGVRAGAICTQPNTRLQTMTNVSFTAALSSRR